MKPDPGESPSPSSKITARDLGVEGPTSPLAFGASAWSSDWEAVSFGETVSVAEGQVNPTEEPYASMYHVGPECVEPGTGRLLIRRTAREVGLKSGKYLFRPCDIVYSKIRPYLRKSILVDFEGICSADMYPLTARPGFDAGYLNAFILSNGFTIQAVAQQDRTGIPKLNREQLNSILVPKPPLAEQRRIAAVVSTVQTALGMQDRIVATLKELKAATLAKLFREGLRGEPLKQTEIGEIPGNWKVIRLGNHCAIGSGGTPSRDRSEYWGGSIPWVKTGEIDYRPILKTEERITEAGLASSSTRLFPKGTLLMAMYGQGVTRGKVAFLEIEAATNQACAALFPDQNVDSGYLYSYCVFAYERIRELGHGANQKNLSADLIRTMPVPLPPSVEEQRDIYSVVKGIDSRLRAAETRLERLRALFGSALRQLMSGQVRVPLSVSAPGDVVNRRILYTRPPGALARRPAEAGTETTAPRRPAQVLSEETLQEIVRRIVEAAQPEKIILFGSAARGEMGPDSDVDLLVVKSGVHRRELAARLYRELADLPVPKDIIVATPEDLERHRDTVGLVYRAALREGRVVYDAA